MAQLRAIQRNIELYRLEHGHYPTQSQGLSALIEVGLLKRQDLIDPWGMPFQYAAPGAWNWFSFDLFSLGSDGVAGTSEPDGQDIANW